MNVLIISGFLGAGKTTFIQAMANATGRQFVIVENEFANTNIDSKILAGDEMKIYELTEGCICCSMNMDFSLSIMTIANTLQPDYVIVEPSGVALPSRIISSLRKISYENIGVLSPIVIVDAKNFRQERANYPEYFYDQLENAGTVVLSKSEDFSDEDFSQIINELQIAENVNFPRSHYSTWPREKWLELLSMREFGGNSPRPAPEAKLESITLQKVLLPSPDALAFRLDEMLSGKFGNIARAKGFVMTNRECLEFSLVGGTYEITSHDGIYDELAIIGEGLDDESIAELFGAELAKEND